MQDLINAVGGKKELAQIATGLPKPVGAKMASREIEKGLKLKTNLKHKAIAHAEKGANRITGEVSGNKIAVDASVGMPIIDIPKPVIYVGIGLGVLIVGGIIWKLVK